MSAKNTPEKFWVRVQIGAPDVCWEWLGAKSSSGYGNLSWLGLHVQAHRVAYFLGSGNIDLHTNFRQKGVAKRYQKFVLHKCDNRLCCNPKHLFLGSMRTNLLDAYEKGRKTQPKSQHANAKLTAAQVIEIRKRYDAGETKQKQLAAEFGVTQRVISLVTRHETYRDV
jgi:hypothetical protein